MKNTLFCFLLIASNQLFAQFSVHVVDVVANDLAYDANTNKIYVTIPSSNGSNGNSIGTINLDNYSLDTTVFIGSEPTVMAITDNGQYIYVGFAGSSTARRYNIMEQSAGLQFPIGSDPNTGALYVEDIEALPGIPGSVAISRMNNGFSPRHEGVAIYDDGVARPMTTQDHTGSNRIEFNSANSMLGYNNETTEFGLRRISVTAGGVNEVTVSQSILSGFYLDFIYHGNYVYATDGTVVDVTAAPFVAGHFNGAAGPAVYDHFNGMVCYATTDFSGVITFQRYSPASFLLQDAMPIGQAFGFVFNIISCGEDCYAFNTEDNKVIILDKFTSLAGDLESNSRPLTIYPNPVTDYFSIEADNYAFTKVSIIGIDGKTFRNYNTLSGNKYDISDLEKGIYMVKMLDENGRVFTSKLIK